MKLLARILLLPLALATQLSYANAESGTFPIGGVNLTLVAPKGFCMADQSNMADAQFTNLLADLLQRAQNRLIATTIQCDVLQKFRARAVDKVTDYASYYTPFQVEGQSFPGDPTPIRKAICDQMRQQGSASLDGVKDIVAKKAAEMGQNVGVSSTNYIGVLDEDTNGCYAALLVGVRDAKGKNTVMSSIVTSTIVRGKMVFFAYYAEYTGPDTTVASLKAAKEATAELIAANK